MPIKYRKGDVLEAFRNGEVDVVIHQTNCQGVMGSGIARQIKEQYPEAYKEYKELQEDGCGKLYLGEVSAAVGIKRVNQKRHGMILNVNGQDKYIDRNKCNTNYAYLAVGLIASCEYLEKADVVAMPKIGAGLGGGDWNVIEAIINSVFHDRDVFVYEYNKG